MFHVLAEGLSREIVSHKGIIVLPKYDKETGEVNLGSVSAALIGGFAGAVAPYAFGANLYFSALAGYVGQDFIENLIEKTVGKHEEEKEKAQKK